jgi:hypothetical protein
MQHFYLGLPLLSVDSSYFVIVTSRPVPHIPLLVLETTFHNGFNCVREEKEPRKYDTLISAINTGTASATNRS